MNVDALCCRLFHFGLHLGERVSRVVQLVRRLDKLSIELQEFIERLVVERERHEGLQRCPQRLNGFGPGGGIVDAIELVVEPSLRSSLRNKRKTTSTICENCRERDSLA